ncbi:MAG: GxGYxYP family putative glycoside hydrolase [Planctomycetota bacterium]|nr:GxGYxYP family putative glycoside hydrolase [Planctomycetota bacterium]
METGTECTQGSGSVISTSTQCSPSRKPSMLSARDQNRKQWNLAVPLILAVCMACVPAAEPRGDKQAWIVDLGGIHDTKEMYLAAALQGIVNRDKPRLFYLTHCEWSTADRLHAEYLTRKKGYSFTQLDSLGEAVKHFAGMGLVKGLVEYELPEGNWNWGRYGFYGHIAITMAGLKDLLPVTPDILKGETGLLAGRLTWTQDDMDKGGWDEMWAEGKSSSKGLTIKPFAKQALRPANYGCYRSRWVNLDINATPTLEVTIEEATGPWGVVMKMGSHQERDMEGLRVAGPLDKAGVFSFDLRKAGLGDPPAGHAELRLCALSQDTSFTVRRVRFLDANGKAPLAKPDRQDWFAGIPVVQDLRNRFGKDEETACQWALKELLPQCSKDVVVHAQSWWTNLRSLDYAVSRKAFIFYQNHKLYIEPYPYFDEVMKHLNPMAEVLGWGGDESFWVHKVSFLGKREISAFAANLSFWRGVPLDGELKHPCVEQVQGPVRNKYYVNFLMSSGDAIGIVAGYQHGAWVDPMRGAVPVTWGTNPNLVNMAPALMELFASEATPLDSFCAGPSGSGYNSPAVCSSSSCLTE